jgi:hypothetical protein
MSRRAFYIVPLAPLVFLLSSAGSFHVSHQPALTLRIESLSHYPINVRVSTIAMGRERARVQPHDTVIHPPAVLPIADSIGRIHIVVTGFGSSRATLLNSEPPQDSIISEGRDITLARKANGRFERVWTVQPLLP